MRIAMGDGPQLDGTVLGSGPPIVWLSGGPGCNNYLAPVAQTIPGHRHIVFDPRGTGASEGGPHSLSRAIGDLEALRRALKVDQWVVVGHSWGADLALAYALSHPQPIASVISFAGTGVQNDRDWKAAYEAKHDAEPRTPSITSNREVHRELLADWRRFIKGEHLLANLARLTTPITFLQAGHDIRPGWPAAQLANLIPNGSSRVLCGAPHESWLTHADELTAMLCSILNDGDSSTGEQR